MVSELPVPLSFAAGGAAALGGTPLAIRLARRTGFFDHPRGYRSHGVSTPLLGGTAVLGALVLAAVVTGSLTPKLAILVTLASILWLLGTVDDRHPVAPIWRLIAEIAVAAALYDRGLGWKIAQTGGVQLAVTVIWVVTIVNAFNLMDNLDGACATTGCISGAGIGTLAAVQSQTAIAGVAFGLCGACAGFLPYNLARPSKIFLGDGGSMSIGFLVAGLAMLTAQHEDLGDTSLLAAAMLAGLPVLDTSLVSVSRTRRGVPLTTGGRDHLTHRVLPRLGSARAVCACLALIQLLLAGVAIGAEQLGRTTLEAIGGAAFVIGLASIAILDSPSWRPGEIAGDRPPAAPTVSPASDGASGSSEFEALGLDRM